MKRLNLLLLFVVLSFVAMAQSYPKHAQYVKFGSSTAWYSAYDNWQPGTSLYNGTDDAENEQFFVSRVKPRERFSFIGTQVKEDLNPERKLLWWCPLGDADNGNWNAIPSYWFGGEVYSMWSYTDIYSNWSSPIAQASAAFLDVCHKNGVRSGVVATVSYGAMLSPTDGGHGSNINAMVKGGADKLLKYLRYYGIDGVGFNSEFSWDKLDASAFKTMMGDCYDKADSYNVPFNNVWYSFTNNSGSFLSDYSALNNNCVEWFQYNNKTVSDAYFLNYNWGSSQLATSQSTAQGQGRSSFDLYAGIDYQGRSSASWQALKNYDISIGVWGAHDMNMIYSSRGELGSDPLQKQKTYQLISENSFTGSSYNPVNTPEIQSLIYHTSNATDFHGFSSFITARSTMMAQYGDGTLAGDPFVTYFNLGNGLFFKEEGETTFNHEWYNLGMQDYLPTWRWWWTKSFMGKNATDASTDMVAEFTWDDAWFGGSCLQISGASESAYLQLFKTKYLLQNNDVFTIRYKVVSGSGSIKLTTATESNPSVEVSSDIVVNGEGANDVWLEKTIKVSASNNGLKLNGETLAMIGLKFENTSSDFKVFIGEISLTRGTSATPYAPIVTMSKTMARNYKGVDMKIVFDMSNNYTGVRSDYETIYNSDVDTWYYKIYTQQEGGEAVLCTATTSWAAYVVEAPYDATKGGKVRIGVSSVAMDGNSESAIAWGEWQNIPELTILEGFSIDKPVVKANEEFTIAFDDPNHAPATWVIKASDDNEVMATFNASSFTTSLPEEGLYDLYLTQNGVTKLYRGKIQISTIYVGAMPKVESFIVEDNIGEGGEMEFSYTGREDSDGFISRGMVLEEKAFGIPADQLNFNDESSFTLTFWFKVNKFYHENDGTQFLNIRTADDSWPASDWGYVWSQFVSNDNDNESELSLVFRSISSSAISPIFTEEILFEENVWYHMAFVFGYTDNRILTIYLNGKQVGEHKETKGIYSWKSSNVIMIGGRAYNRAGLNGMVDDVCLFSKTLTATEVKETMNRITNITDENFIGYWDFESNPNSNNELLSTGYNKNLIAGYYDVTSLSGSQYKQEPLKFEIGAPFISGTNYKVETLPTWKFKGGSLLSSVGDNASGSASVAYSDEGSYSATLTLSNYWGSDTKQIEFVVSTAIKDVTLEEMQAYPNPFENEVYLKFADAGNYTAEIYDYSGRLISSSILNVTDGQIINIPIVGQSGIYFIKLKGEAGLLKVMKVIKK
ncbi:MAG: T9SS type A sorting domain-containing protein [Muribaculaceae bacterium]|nr:T9SS type A sorting domain-containing protein [Muribaculaceae bacterium]